MYPISINPFINRNLFDNYIESISILGQYNKYNYCYALSQLGIKNTPYLDWTQMLIQDFVGHDVNIDCRLTILSCLIGSLTDEQFDKEYEDSLNKYILKKEELEAIREEYSNVDNYINYVDFIYRLSSNLDDKEELITKYKNVISTIAHGGYDLIYFFADVSSYDYKQEFRDVVANRQLCYEVIDDILKKEKEVKDNGSGTENI